VKLQDKWVDLDVVSKIIRKFWEKAILILVFFRKCGFNANGQNINSGHKGFCVFREDA